MYLHCIVSVRLRLFISCKKSTDDREEDQEEEPSAVKEEPCADSSFTAEPFGGPRIEPLTFGEPRIEPLTCQNKPIRINVGGKVFTTSLETVTR